MKIDAAIQGPLDLEDSNGVTKGHIKGQKTVCARQCWGEWVFTRHIHEWETVRLLFYGIITVQVSRPTEISVQNIQTVA